MIQPAQQSVVTGIEQVDSAQALGQRPPDHLPSGTVTFLLTDVEESVRLFEEHPDEMRRALLRHDELVQQSVAASGGYIVKSRGEGDSSFAVFERPSSALQAAVTMQLAMIEEAWPTHVPLRVRMAIHTGEDDLLEGDYRGSAVNRCARLRGKAHGRQILMTATTYDLCRAAMPPQAGVIDMGKVRLRGFSGVTDVLQLTHPGLPRVFPPLSEAETPPNNLPAEVTSFIDRESEVASLVDLAHKTRLITVTGMGGSGKSRLVRAVAAELMGDFLGGVWWIPLAQLTDAELLTQHIANTINVTDQPRHTTEERLQAHFHGLDALLVFDSCENVTRPLGRLITALLPASSGLRVLCTSRVPLQAPDETVWPIPAMSLPDGGREMSTPELRGLASVQLFAARAGTRLPGFEVTSENAALVTAICQRLGVLPLALELAAAQVRSIPLSRLAKEVATAESATSHRSVTQILSDAIHWIYDRLSNEQQSVFNRLAVFSGGFDLDAAEGVACFGTVDSMVVTDSLTLLYDCALIQARHSPAGDIRYDMLEPLRLFGLARLADSNDQASVEERHAMIYSQLARTAEIRFKESDGLAWLQRLKTDHDNFRAALTWCWKHRRLDIGLGMAAAMWRYWSWRGQISEGREHLQRLLALDERSVPRPQRDAALNAAGCLAYLDLDFEGAEALWRESLSIREASGNQLLIAATYNNLASMKRAQSEFDAAGELWQRSLEYKRRAGDMSAVPSSLDNLGQLYTDLGQFEKARACLDECISIRRAREDWLGLPEPLSALGQLEYLEGYWDAARVAFEESLSIAERLDDRSSQTRALTYLSKFFLRTQNLVAAASYAELAESMADNLGIPDSIFDAYCTKARVLLAQGRLTEAERRVGQLKEIWDPQGNLIAIALLQLLEARLAMAHGHLDEACRHVREGLNLVAGSGLRPLVVELLEESALLANEWESNGITLALGRACEAERKNLAFPIPPNDAARYEQALTESRRSFVVAESQDAQLRTLSLDDACRFAVDWLTQAEGSSPGHID